MNTKRVLAPFFYVVVLLTISFAGVYVYRTNAKVRKTVDLATTVKPETFSELYFENYLNLPKDTTLNTKRFFHFTVHNLEYKDMLYVYEVYLDKDGKKLLIQDGTIKLRQDEYKTTDVSYTLFYPIKRAKVVVNLRNKNQQIDFWIGESE